MMDPNSWSSKRVLSFVGAVLAGTVAIAGCGSPANFLKDNKEKAEGFRAAILSGVQNQELEPGVEVKIATAGGSYKTPYTDISLVRYIQNKKCANKQDRIAVEVYVEGEPEDVKAQDLSEIPLEKVGAIIVGYGDATVNSEVKEENICDETVGESWMTSEYSLITDPPLLYGGPNKPGEWVSDGEFSYEDADAIIDELLTSQ